MDIKQFIESIQNHLEDVNTSIDATTDYINLESWDSLTAMVVKVMIEDDYGVDVPVEKINSFSSIQELFDYIRNFK
ncbi:MAG: acyl carrier protein [Sphingobacterium sp.]